MRSRSDPFNDPYDPETAEEKDIHMESMRRFHPSMYKKLKSMTPEEREEYARRTYRNWLNVKRTEAQRSLVLMFIPELWSSFYKGSRKFISAMIELEEKEKHFKDEGLFG